MALADVSLLITEVSLVLSHLVGLGISDFYAVLLVVGGHPSAS